MAARTDLHSHFAGALSPDDIIDLAKEHNVKVSARILKKCGFVNEDYDGDGEFIENLPQEQIEQFRKKLALVAGRQNLFNEMENIYTARSFITKNPEMFGPVLERIGQRYAEQGVQYVELSTSLIISNPKLLAEADKLIPEIEEKYGVKLRLLATIKRNFNPALNLDEMDRLKKILQNPYVVGVDIAGHEGNPIRNLKEPLGKIIRYASGNIPGFVVRIHAGENPHYSADPDRLSKWDYNNAYEAVQIAQEARRDEEGNLTGPYGADIQIRLGHGRYGLQEKTLKLMKDAGVMVELCFTSNQLLNHADDTLKTREGVIHLYESHKIPIVLGTDGFGLYHTTISKEFRKACKTKRGQMLLGKMLRESEDSILGNDGQRTETKKQIWESFLKSEGYEGLLNVEYETKSGQPRYNETVARKNKRRLGRTLERQQAVLQAQGVDTNEVEIQTILKNRKILVFSGASKNSWEKVPEGVRERVKQDLEGLMATLKGSEYAIVIGGVDFGFEALVGEVTERRNEHLSGDDKIPIIGFLTSGVNFDSIRQGDLSHAVILKRGDSEVESWIDQADIVLDMVQEHGAHVIYGGGGQITRDGIVNSAQRGLIQGGNVTLLGYIPGASQDFGKQFPEVTIHNGGLTKRITGSLPPTFRGEISQGDQVQMGGNSSFIKGNFTRGNLP